MHSSGTRIDDFAPLDEVAAAAGEELEALAPGDFASAAAAGDCALAAAAVGDRTAPA